MKYLSSLIQTFRFYFYRLKGFKNIEQGVILESRLNLDKVYPAGIHILNGSLIASGVTILCHEHIKRNPSYFFLPATTETYIGKNCFIGINATILPGVRIGDSVIIGASSVVTKDIPSNSIAVGNPAKILSKKVILDNNAIII